ncbi:MAG: complexed with cef1p [Vezdaea aestivalis]|nr:MAG: complexed with cef1p [Vezdaea aestivalis]
MTTAHRPTFDPARGKEAQRGPAYHQRLLPAHKDLKVRQPGQGGAADAGSRDLRAELLKAEAAYAEKTKQNAGNLSTVPAKRQLENPVEDVDGETPEQKRLRVLEESRDLDADSEVDSSEEDDDDRLALFLYKKTTILTFSSEDEQAELERELAMVREENARRKKKEEQEKAAEDEAQREVDIARGNPLLNSSDFNVKRRWDDDVVFKNQARGTDDKRKKEFVNDLLRSDFHKRFMSKYVR